MSHSRLSVSWKRSEKPIRQSSQLSLKKSAEMHLSCQGIQRTECSRMSGLERTQRASDPLPLWAGSVKGRRESGWGGFTLQGRSFECQHTLLLYLSHLSTLTTVWINQIRQRAGQPDFPGECLSRPHAFLTAFFTSAFLRVEMRGLNMGQSWCKTGQRPRSSWQN